MKIIARKHLWQLTGLAVADLAVFSFTNTENVPSFMLIVGFLLLMATFYNLVYSLLTFARLYGLSIRRKRRLAGSFTAVTGVLLALQSMGQLNSRDVSVLLPLVVIGYLYSYYGKTGAGSLES